LNLKSFPLIWFSLLSIHATAFHPEALQLIVGAGDKVLVYDASDGNLIDTLKGKNR
jgi:hypothetical protein